MSSSALPPLIGPQQAALVRRQVSIIVASRDAAHRPHLMRAVGCRLRDDLRRVTVFLSGSASRQLLADLHACGLVAVVFSEPSTTQTLQLKGSDAVVESLQDGDEALAQAYLEGFIDEIGAIGFPRHVAEAILGHPPGDLVAVSFTPSAAFEQTPGPQAGRAAFA